MHTGVLEMLMGVQLLNSDGTSCRFLCSGGAGSRFASKDHSFYPQISDEIIGTEIIPVFLADEWLPDGTLTNTVTIDIRPPHAEKELAALLHPISNMICVQLSGWSLLGTAVVAR